MSVPNPNAKGSDAYVYLFSTSVDHIFKIGFSNSPEYRWRDCYKCTGVLTTVFFDKREDGFAYERALHKYYDNCRARCYGLYDFTSEYFVMTKKQAAELESCKTESDLNWLMGIHEHYTTARSLGQTFNPLRYVKTVKRWYRVEKLGIGEYRPYISMSQERWAKHVNPKIEWPTETPAPGPEGGTR